MLAAAFKLTQAHGRLWLALGSIVSVIWGVLLLIVGAVVLTWWLGAYALVFGIALLVLAFQLRAHRDDTRASVAARPA